ncbi:MAG: hypothetical protein QM788_06210 [Roseateles sp.]|uniref:hypothetical protein n=1 Tax=Roseateles sp. TaxID=1971397 RepID=UPI0039ED11AA
MWADGAIVHVLAHGPFNREGVDLFSAEMLSLYRRLPAGARVVNITEVRGAMLGTPDAWERLSEHLAAGVTLGLPLLGTAWVAAPDVDGRTLMLPRAAQAFAQVGRRFEAFETMDEAERWARRLLAI